MKKQLYLFLHMLSIALGALLAVEPFECALAGLISAMAMILFSQQMLALSWKKSLFYGLSLSLMFTIVVFPWLLVTLLAISDLSIAISIIGFIGFALVSQIKFPIIILAYRAIKKMYNKDDFWLIPLLALAADMFTYQIFPWYWGNFNLGFPFLPLAASAIGVIGLSFVLFVKAQLLLRSIAFTRTKYAQIMTTKLPNNNISNYKQKRKKKKDISVAKKIDYIGFQSPHIMGAIIILLFFYIYGFFWQRYIHGKIDAAPDLVSLAMIQPNTAKALNQYQGDDDYSQQAMTKVISLAVKAITEMRNTLDLIIIPESAIPFYGTLDNVENKKVSYSPSYHGLVAALSEYGSLDVIYNELFFEQDKQRNAMTVFNHRKGERLSYRKQELVPFGEFLPFENGLPQLRYFFPQAGHYHPDTESSYLSFNYQPQRFAQPLSLNPNSIDLQELHTPKNILSRIRMKYEPNNTAILQGHFLPLICYEGLFPSLVSSFIRTEENQKPDFIVNIVNDSWFGNGLENYQHYGLAKFRAIENGRYLVRATLTGPNAIINPFGETEVGPSPLGKDFITVARIPILEDVQPIYWKLGHWPHLILLALSLVFVMRHYLWGRIQQIRGNLFASQEK